MSITTGLFSLTFCCAVTPISGIKYHYCIMDKEKKGNNKNNLRAIYSENHENFKSSKPRDQFYWLLWKSVVCLLFQVVQIKQVDCKVSTKDVNNYK